MQEADVKRVISEVLAEQQRLHRDAIDDVAMRTIVQLLTSFGFDEEDRLELRADFQHLRRFRKSFEQAQRAGLKAAITMLVTGFCGLVWLGFKIALGK